MVMGPLATHFQGLPVSAAHPAILVVHCLVFAMWGLDCYTEGNHFFHYNLTLNRTKTWM